MEWRKRYDDAGAADWLFDNNFDIPSDMVHFVQDRLYRPDEVAVPSWDESTDKPNWSAETFELCFRGNVVRKVNPRAKNVIRVLTAFQECDWPKRVDSDFTSDEAGKQKRREAISTLNDGLTAIQFRSDGSGEGIEWRIVVVTEDLGGGESDVPF